MTNWHDVNEHFNALIKQMFHEKDWQKRAEAVRQLGFLKDWRATNLLCRALRTEENDQVINRIIEALGRIGDPKATLRIIEKLKEEQEEAEIDKFRLISIIESLINLKDKRALVFISPFLNSPDESLKKLAIEAFDTIEPNWRAKLKENKQRSIEEIFDIKI